MALHPKIKELKRRASPINYSNVAVNERGELTSDFASDLENRIISGYLLVWGAVNMHGEMFLRGCASKSINDRGPKSNANYKLTFLNQHRQHEALCQFDELIEDDYGLRFRTKSLDSVPWADHVITQVRSGTLNQFSVGFDYIWQQTEWDEKNDCILCKEIDLFEGSIVTIGSEIGTYVIRSKDEADCLFDEIDSFIKTLPRKDQLQARQYFTQLKSLTDLEPLTHEEALDKRSKPTKNAIDYNYLINNI